MRKTKSLSITLTHELAEMVGRKVASGEYASESEVIRDGLRALDARTAAFEQWLRTEGVATYRAYKSNPDDVLDAATVEKNLERMFAELRTGKRSRAA